MVRGRTLSSPRACTAGFGDDLGFDCGDMLEIFFCGRVEGEASRRCSGGISGRELGRREGGVYGMGWFYLLRLRTLRMFVL